MPAQKFNTTDKLRVQVQQAWAGPPNIVDNPIGDQLAALWRITATTGPAILASGPGAGFTVSSGGTMTLIHDDIPVDRPVGTQKLRAQFTRITGTSGKAAQMTVACLDKDKNVLATYTSASTSGTNSTVNLLDSAIPADTNFIRITFTFTTLASGEGVQINNIAVWCGTAAALSAGPLAVTRTWTDLVGSSTEVEISRSELQVGQLTATVRNSTYDPATSTLLRRGRTVRAQALVSSTWRDLFNGKILGAKTEYELKDPAVPNAKRTKIALVATDAVTTLANASRPQGVGTLAELAWVLSGTGVPWNINGDTGARDPATVTVVSKNADAMAIDQVAITRDSVRGYAWVDVSGTLQAWDAASLSTTVVDTLDEATYSDLSIDFDIDRCINSVTIEQLEIDTGTGDGITTTWGPYTNEASIREWDRHFADFTVQGIADANVPAYAAAVLAANSTPKTRVNSLTLPLRTVAELEAHVLRDLYDLVRVKNTRAGSYDENLRVVSIKHRINGSGWLLDVGFAGDGLVATPQVTPSPALPPAQTTSQRLRPVGEVTMWYGAKAACPAGWLVLDGSTFSATSYPELAALIGTNVLPNWTDRFPIGAGTKALGTSGGQSTAPLPNHKHTGGTHTHPITSGNLGVTTQTNTATGGSATRVTNVNDPHAHGGATGSDGAVLTSDPTTSPNIDVLNPWRALWFIIRATGAGNPGKTYRATVLEDAPALYLPGNEAAGGTGVSDASGNGRNGTSSAAIVPAAALGPQLGTCLDLGTGDYVNVPYGSWLDGSNAWTVECWFQLDTLPGAGARGTLLSCRTDVDTSGVFQIQVYDNKLDAFYGTGGNFHEAAGTTNLLTGTPYHLCVVNTDTSIKVYLNNVLEASAAYSSSARGVAARPFRVGNDERSDRNGIDGKFSHIAYYNAALSAARVQAHYLAAS